MRCWSGVDNEPSEQSAAAVRLVTILCICFGIGVDGAEAGKLAGPLGQVQQRGKRHGQVHAAGEPGRPARGHVQALAAAEPAGLAGRLPRHRARRTGQARAAPTPAPHPGRRRRAGPFRVVKPCGRCVVTATDQVTGERGRQPLMMLGRRRRFGKRLVFGQNLIPDGGGVIRVGDPVEILETA